MKPQPIVRPGDCLATAIAAMLDIDAILLPSAVDPDWDTGYQNLRRELAKRGWRLGFHEYEGPDISVAAMLDHSRQKEDDVDAQCLWLVSCSHPSWAGDGHVIVALGSELVFDPGGDEYLRPPLDEISYHGGFLLSPLDPSAFEHRIDA